MEERLCWQPIFRLQPLSSAGKSHVGTLQTQRSQNLPGSHSSHLAILPLARSDFYLGSTQQSPTPDLQIRDLLEWLKGIFGGQIMQQIFLRRKETENLSLLPSAHHFIVVPNVGHYRPFGQQGLCPGSTGVTPSWGIHLAGLPSL